MSMKDTRLAVVLRAVTLLGRYLLIAALVAGAILVAVIAGEGLPVDQPPSWQYKRR